MKNTLCSEFEFYIQDADNIFDIMAIAYKLLSPFETKMTLDNDPVLQNIVYNFAEQYNVLQALADLKIKLKEWIQNLYESEKDEVKRKLFCLLRLIDRKCVNNLKCSLPDSYIHFDSLNTLFQDEFIIVPRLQSKALDLLAKTISKCEGHRFYGRNYAGTGDVSRYIHNFVIYWRNHNIRPRISVPKYGGELRDEFEQKDFKLIVAVFPTSNINLEKLFRVEKNIVGEEGTFSISCPKDGQETILLNKCINALETCRNRGVDIAVFPEMLFTEKNQKEVIDYIKKNGTDAKPFPWFMWLGTVWSNRENKCMVIDRYGKEVFTQKKRVPYEYKIQKVCNGENKIVRLREELSCDTEWVVNFLDIPCLFRIATAICRDISDDYLKGVIKELYSDMAVIPAFSQSDRLTDGNIVPLALEHINTLVCNACSAMCSEKKEKYEINEELVNRILPFCYLCTAAKQTEKNRANFCQAQYTQSCMDCDEECKGFIWEISFGECVEDEKGYAAKVERLNF